MTKLFDSLDIDWLKATFPHLEVDYENKTIRGVVDFKMYYLSKEPNQYIIDPDDSFDDLEGCVIKDKYNLEIKFNNSPLPSVRELDGRIQASKKKWGIKENIDIHLFL